jgi:hypothetical protein
VASWTPAWHLGDHAGREGLEGRDRFLSNVDLCGLVRRMPHLVVQWGPVSRTKLVYSFFLEWGRGGSEIPWGLGWRTEGKAVDPALGHGAVVEEVALGILPTWSVDENEEPLLANHLQDTLHRGQAFGGMAGAAAAVEAAAAVAETGGVKKTSQRQVVLPPQAVA